MESLGIPRPAYDGNIKTDTINKTRVVGCRMGRNGSE
jgi:hypothetical protein